MKLDMNQYGFPMDLAPEASSELLPGRVTQAHREYFKVVCSAGEAGARLKGSAYRQRDAGELYPTVGDFVLLRYSAAGESVIERTLPRRSAFIRADPFGRGPSHTETSLEQVAAANFDTVFVLMSLNQNFNVRRLERYLAAAWESGGTPVVLLTKADLAPESEALDMLRQARETAVGAEVLPVSSQSGQGLGALAPYLAPGRTVVFLGSSGVGKSTLVNALAGGEVMQVGGIREEDARGRHTTTHRELLLLPGGAMVIDTPGMRTLGLANAQGLADAFGELEELFARCRYRDCTHTGEPGCAALAALEAGSLSPARWEAYRKLQREARFAEDKAGYIRQRTAKRKKDNRAARH